MTSASQSSARSRKWPVPSCRVFRRLWWRRAFRAAKKPLTAETAETEKKMQRMLGVLCVLCGKTASVADDFEVALRRALQPRTADHALIRTDVFQLAIDRIVHRLS